MSKTLPSKGTPREQVMQQLKSLHADDAKWKDGRTFSLVYFAGPRNSCRSSSLSTRRLLVSPSATFTAMPRMTLATWRSSERTPASRV